MSGTGSIRVGRGGLACPPPMVVVVAKLCPTLRDPMDCKLPGSSVHGILQARILEWVAISFSRDLPNPGIEPGSPALQADLPYEVPGNADYMSYY